MESKNKSLSISIVVYKEYNDVIECIDSIEKYTNKNISKIIYIVDNTPPNSSGIESFKQYIKKYTDVVYIKSSKNLGFGKGHNLVLPFLTTNYHAIVNPDVIIQEDVLFNIINYMNNNHSIGMVVPKITDIKGNFLHVYRKYPTVFDMFIRMFCRNFFKKRQANHSLMDNDFTKPFNVPFAQGSFFVVRTELLNKLQGFDERFFMYLEDVDLCRRINKFSKIMYYPYSTVIHKWKKGSHKNIKLFRIHLVSMIVYFNKWGWDLF